MSSAVRVVSWFGVGVAAVPLVAVVGLRSLATLVESGGATIDQGLGAAPSLAQPLTAVALGLALVAWGAAALGGLRFCDRLGNRALVMLALVAALQLVASYLGRLVGSVLFGVLGPFSIFISGVADEGLPCLLLAIALVLAPRPGVALVVNLTLWTLMIPLTGLVGVVDAVFVTVSIVVHEALLAAGRVTTGPALRQPRPTPSAAIIVRLALAIGCANGTSLALQYGLSQSLFRLQFADWFVLTAATAAAVYGALGAAAGTVLGYRLRRVAP
jgi:hypothetical protein